MKKIYIIIYFLLPSLLYASWTDETDVPLEVLWEIGKSDNDNSDLQFAPNQFHLYRNPGIHIAGVSDPAQSWPYILPGPLDLWAGKGPHSFEIVFFLDDFRQESDCQLIVDILDAHSFKPSKLELRLNNSVFEHQFEPGNNDWLMSAMNNSGREQLASFTLPASALRPGENTIGLTATEGSYILWDAIRFEVPAGISLSNPEKSSFIRSIHAQQLLLKSDQGLKRPILLDVIHTGSEIDATVKVSGNETQSVRLLTGRQSIEVLIPENTETKDLKIELISDGKVIASSSRRIEPVRKWEVHLIHQTHLDIGFTHTQEEVLEMQIKYLYEALELIEKTRDYPEGARFKWHAEGMWAIDEFLRTAPEEKKQQFIKALKDQSIHLDAFYVHLLTGLATDEEMLELMQPAKQFEKKYGIPLISAIGSDVPGYSWGLVTAMAHQGIKFLNMAPNNNHRLGYLFHYADYPFFWTGPDGHSKVLTWMASHAYIYFWEQDARLEKVSRFLEYLEGKDFPYDIAMLRYEVGGDNGFPDARLPERVKAWNEKYAWPRILISTNSQLYHTFIDHYEDQIPIVSGELTPYWEDGATSTAADLAISRRAGERILQAQNLQAMIAPEADLADDFDRAWNNILMYDEHTWGAWSSISDPYGDFTVRQDRYKQKFALDARDQTMELMKAITSQYTKPGSGVIDVYNTLSWERSGLVYLSPDQSAGGDWVVNDRGQAVPCQRLAGGELVFQADRVPAFGAMRYRITDEEAKLKNPFTIDGSFISNEKLSVTIDPERGAVSSLLVKETGQELVDASEGRMLNDYVYIPGRDENTDWLGVNSPVQISVEDAGPLIGTVRIESGAAGCERLIRRISLIAGQERLDLVNTIDKKKELEPEQAYFTFPLNIPEGRSRIDIPWGAVRPETDQMAGANRNYFTIQRWLDISNQDAGVTWISLDAPMVKLDPIRIIGKGRGEGYAVSEFGLEGMRPWWNKTVVPSQTFYSWILTNHWEVNYKAYQEGEITFQYALIPHKSQYDGAKAERAARNITQALLALEADPGVPVYKSLLDVASEKIIVTSVKPTRDGKALIVRLYNTGSSTGSATLNPAAPDQCTFHICNTMGDPIRLSDSSLELPAFGMLTIRIEKNK